MSSAPPAGARRVELIAFFGALTAFAPLSTDMYLPAIPSIAHDFHATIGAAEHTLTAFFLGFALGQALFGPLADRFGRRGPLLWGLAIYVASCILCAATAAVPLLTVLRFLQAVSACAGAVIARACVRDLFAPDEAPRIYAFMMLVMGMAPLLAPLLGGYLLIAFGWRAIFLTQGLLGVAAILVTLFRLPESHAGPRRALHLATIFVDYARIAVDRRFIGYVLAASTSAGGLFAYVTGSPHVFIDIFHVPAQRFGWFFGTNALGLVGFSQLAGRLLRSRKAAHVLLAAQSGQACAGILLLVFALTGIGGVWGIAAGLWFYVGLNGAVMPTASGLAMRPFSLNAGMASALLGTFQFGLATVTSLVVGALHQTSALPMAAVIAVCGVTGLTFNLLLSPKPA
ncbi:MAG TPA: Bcr/CflA family multidrug efflux MFS transporter [Rhizomicrobium sp.]